MWRKWIVSFGYIRLFTDCIVLLNVCIVDKFECQTLQIVMRSKTKKNAGSEKQTHTHTHTKTPHSTLEWHAVITFRFLVIKMLTPESNRSFIKCRIATTAWHKSMRLVTWIWSRQKVWRALQNARVCARFSISSSPLCSSFPLQQCTIFAVQHCFSGGKMPFKFTNRIHRKRKRMTQHTSHVRSGFSPVAEPMKMRNYCTKMYFSHQRTDFQTNLLKKKKRERKNACSILYANFLSVSRRRLFTLSAQTVVYFVWIHVIL